MYTPSPLKLNIYSRLSSSQFVSPECLFVCPNFKERRKCLQRRGNGVQSLTLHSLHLCHQERCLLISTISLPGFVNRLYYAFTLPVCVLSDVGSENQTTSAAVWGEEKKKKIIVAFNDFCLLLPFVWTPEWRCARTCCYGNQQVVLLSSTCFFAVSALLPASISPISMRLALCGKWVMWALSHNRLGLGSAFGTLVVPLPLPPRNNIRAERLIRRGGRRKKWEKDNGGRWRIKEEAVFM